MILAYHRVNPWHPRDALTVAPDRFRAQLAFLLARGWRPAPLSNTAGRRAFSVTFDDGYYDNLRWALPILAKLGVPATVFLAAGLVGTRRLLPRYADVEKDRFLAWEEAAEMARAGVSLGSHGLSHPRLTGLPREKARAEIAGSKRLIEERLGRPTAFFCYPYGDFDDDVVALVRDAGYDGAVVTPPRPIVETRYTRLRVGIYGHNSALIYRVKLWKESLRERRSSCSSW